MLVKKQRVPDVDRLFSFSSASAINMFASRDPRPSASAAAYAYECVDLLGASNALTGGYFRGSLLGGKPKAQSASAKKSKKTNAGNKGKSKTKTKRLKSMGMCFPIAELLSFSDRLCHTSLAFF